MKHSNWRLHIVNRYIIPCWVIQDFTLILTAFLSHHNLHSHFLWLSSNYNENFQNGRLLSVGRLGLPAWQHAWRPSAGDGLGFCLNMLMMLMVIATIWAEYGGDDVVDSSKRWTESCSECAVWSLRHLPDHKWSHKRTLIAWIPGIYHQSDTKKHTIDMEQCNPVALNSIWFEWDTRLPEYFLLPLLSYFRSERSPGEERWWSVPAGVEGDRHKASLIKSRLPGDWWRSIVINDLWLPKLAFPWIRQPLSWFATQFSLSQQPFSCIDNTWSILRQTNHPTDLKFLMYLKDAKLNIK